MNKHLFRPLLLLVFVCLLQGVLPSKLVWALPPTPFVTTAGNTLQYQGQRYYLHGINYYPQKTPWSLFWPQYHAESITQDLKRIQQLGFNTVRIFVPYTQFGSSQLYHRRLKDFLDQAGKSRLKVIVTLFDFFTDYAHISASQQHIKQLVPGLAQHPALLAWDLKNEGDLDYQYGQTKVLHWLKQMAISVRQLDHNHLITAGWSAPMTAADTAPYVDYVTFHDYRDEGRLADAIRHLQKQTSKPLVLGEYGFHTWEKSPQDPHHPEHQYNYFNAVLASALQTNLSGQMAWNLYDFSPHLKEPLVLTGESVQYHMGLLNIQGKPKAGVLALQQAAFVVDAATQRAIDSRTQRIEVVFRLSQATQVHLSLHQDGKTITQHTWYGKKNLNRFEWAVSPHLLQELIYLRQHYRLNAAFLLHLNGQPYPAVSQVLRIRER